MLDPAPGYLTVLDELFQGACVIEAYSQAVRLEELWSRPLVAIGGAALVGAIVLFAVDARRGQPEKGARSARLTGTRGLLW